jgi:hypothetical protein
LPGDESTPEHQQELVDWVYAHYHVEQIGPWLVLAKDSKGGADLT